MAGPDIFVGSVAVGVVPDARGIHEKLRQQVVPPAQQVGEEAGDIMGREITDKMTKAGDASGRDFAEEFKSRLKIALDNMPKAVLKGDAGEVNRDLDVIKRRIEGISRQKLFDPERAAVEIEEIRVELDALSDKAKGIDISFDMKKVTAQLGALKTVTRLAAEQGTTTGISKAVTDIEAATQTATGVAGAGSSVLGNILNLLGGGRGGGGGGAERVATTAAEGGSGGFMSSIGGALGGIPLIGGLISGPQAAVTVPALAGVIALAGQQIAGVIVSGLGAVLAGMGIGGALMTGKLAGPIKEMSTAFSNFMKTIGGPLVPVLGTVLDLIAKTVTTLTPVFKGAEQILSGPLQRFLTAIVQSFGLPSVATSIDAVARAFGSVLDAITPTIAPNMNSLANAITNIANQISNNPQAVANFFTLMTNFVVFIINALGTLTDLATKLEQQWPRVAKMLGIQPLSPSLDTTKNAGTALGVAVPGTTGIAAIPAIKGQPAVPAHAAVYDSSGKLIHPATPARPGIAAVPGVPGTPAWAGFTPIHNIGLANQWSTAAIGNTSTRPPGFWGSLANNFLSNPLLNVLQIPVGGGIKLPNPFTGTAAALAALTQSTWTALRDTRGTGTGPRTPPQTRMAAIVTQPQAAAGARAPGLIDSIYNFFQNPRSSGPTAVKTGNAIIDGILKGAEDQTQKSAPQINSKIVTPFLEHLNGPDGFKSRSPSEAAVPTGKDIIGGLMKGMQTAIAGIAPWINANVVSPIMAALAGDTYGFSMFSGGTGTPLVASATAQPSQATVRIGQSIVDGIKQGITDEMTGMDTWVTATIVQPIINYLTSPNGFNIKSPSLKMKPIGKQIVTGIIHGMMEEGGHLGQFVAKVFGDWPQAILSFVSKGLDPTKLNASAKKLLSGIIGGVGTAVGGKYGAANISKSWESVIHAAGGVTRWASTVSKALTMLGLPQNLSGQVLYQMQTESGGNPYAINLTDSNARAGDPSRGLLQTIGATFKQYHVPGTSGNIYDPLANIAAAINYAYHKYGPGLMNAAGQGLGSGHGYDTGGWLPPGVTLAYNYTGRSERVLSPMEYDALQAGGVQYHAHFDGLTGTAIEHHVRTAFNIMSLTQGTLQRQGRRS